MKVLVFGYGSVGRRHVINALTLGCDLAIVDPARDPEQIVRELVSHMTYHADQMRQQQVVAFAQEDDAWAWMPDAVVVATPAATHATMFHDAVMRFDGPIFLEKPLALSVSDYAALWPEHEGNRYAPWTLSNGRRVQIGYNWRFHPLVCAFREGMRELGPPRVATIWVATDMRTWPGAGYADALLECSHEVDLALDLFGPAELSPYPPKRDALRDAWRLELCHASGCRTLVVIVGRAAQSVRGLRVLFAEHEGGYDVPPDDPRSVEALDISYARELRYFLDEVAGRTPPDYEGSPRPATLQDGMEVLRLIDRARALVTA